MAALIAVPCAQLARPLFDFDVRDKIALLRRPQEIP
jgi:hypothetical protein